ncbi:ferredoxin reductase family protein [Paeniglutamicibacter cryotolerans]|uniref:Putative ferric reductase n=1 Tax=Paeniglutamicibacter cryotolerans TaxID=670079 RepID=A0A839QKS5_9MICC|nr:ferredoxin reductase family protein [Paeniglutamicibacter cryotolerans]MBB2996457.1 putative ferric reductase [Paeniglutamicibacter cryotolerans]
MSTFHARAHRPTRSSRGAHGLNRLPVAEQRRRRQRGRMRSADLLATACWSSVAVAVALFLASGGAQVTDVASGLTVAGIVAGLVATDLILVMVLLAARVPLIDRAVGQDSAMVLHRRLGKPVLYLVLGHVVLVTLGYARSDGVGFVDESGMLLSGSDLVLALIGTILLILVVATSIVAVRRRFPYEVWQGIHLLSYAAVFFALPHQLSSGMVLATGTWQRVYWIALYVLVFGAIAWYRLTVPVIRTLRHRIRVEAVEAVAPGVFSIHLSGRDLDRLGALGGQYAIWRFWTAGTWWHAHPVSFSAVPNRTSARITVRELGAGTGRLGLLAPGTPVSIEGPYGIFTPMTRTSPKLAIVAAGIGVTPVRALLEHSTLEAGEVTAVLRGTEHGHLYLWDEMEELTVRRGGMLYAMFGRRPPGSETWLSAEAASRGVTLLSVFPDLFQSDLYVCGPTRWAMLVVRDAREAGLREEQIHLERFDW